MFSALSSRKGVPAGSSPSYLAEQELLTTTTTVHQQDQYKAPLPSQSAPAPLPHDGDVVTVPGIPP